jgi:hypothetical protein
MWRSPLGRAGWRLFVGALVLAPLALLALIEGRAEAYPQWQLSTGATRCSQCHYAPGGGGLITSYGRDAAGDELSTFQTDGNFLHGAVRLPSWLAVGGDLRGAFVSNDVQDPSGTTTAVFPMQADLAARVAFGAGFSLSAIGGFRGQVRSGNDLIPTQNYQPVSTSTLISREHYLMWQPEVIGPYVRAGRFYAPYGLRLAEHILYVNRDLGFDELEETYNVSGGFIYDAWELHLTAFAPDFVRHIGSDESGGAAYYERRLFGDRVALGGQARIAVAPGITRYMVGGVGKAYVDKLRTLFMAEVDGVNLVVSDAAVDARQQVVGAAGFAVLPTRGLIVTLLGERNQIDLSVRDDAYTAATALVNWFPMAHFELQVMGRLQYPGGGPAAKTLFAQLHYYL